MAFIHLSLSLSGVFVKHELFYVAFICEANRPLFFANCCQVYVEYNENYNILIPVR